MKCKILLALMSFILIALAACKDPTDLHLTNQTTDPNVSTTAQLETGLDIEVMSESDCPEATSTTQQLIDAVRGFCLLYPVNFDVNEYGDGLGYTMFIQSLMGNHKSPVVWLTFEEAIGRSLEEVTALRLNDYAFPGTEAQPIMLGNVPASMMDNLPGQDTNRRVVAVQDDRVIDIVIDHIGKNYGAAGEQAEAVYSAITSTFRLIGIESE